MNWLNALYAEQTTANEIVVFLLLGTFFTLLTAFAIYALMLLILSRWRIENKYSLWQLLFPPMSRIRKYVAEYTMSTLTALLLTLSVGIKHQQVNQVLSQDIGLIGQSLVSSVIKYDSIDRPVTIVGGYSLSEEKLLAWLKDKSAKKAGITAQQLIRPLLDEGLNEQADLIVRAITQQMLNKSSPPIEVETLEKFLILIAILLLMGYAIWFSWQRWKSLKNKRTSKLAYDSIVKKLALPAVCIPLLLVSTVALQDSERIIDGAIAKVGATEKKELSDTQQVTATLADESSVNNLVISLLNESHQQGLDYEKSVLENIELAKQEIDRLNKLLKPYSSKFNAIDDRIVVTETTLATLDKAIKNASAKNRRLDTSLKALEAGLASLQTRADSTLTDLRSLNTNQKLLDEKQAELRQMLAGNQRVLESLRGKIDASELSAKNALAKANAAQRAQTGLQTEYKKSVQALRSQHSRDLRELNRQHQKDFSALRSKHARDITSLTTRLTRLEKSQHSHSSAVIQ